MQHLVMGRTSRRLVPLLTYAKMNVPYYRRLFEAANVDLEAIKSRPSAISTIPLLTRDLCQLNRNDMIAEDMSMEEMVVENTSGTTGTPLQIVKAPGERLLAERELWRARVMWGADLLDHSYCQIVSSFGLTSTRPTIRKKGKYLTLRVDWTQPLVKEFNRVSGFLNKYKPKLLRGSTDLFRRYGDMIMVGAVSAPIYTPALIEVTGDFLDNVDREMITEALGAPVANQYGTREVYAMAYSCPVGHMHVLTDSVTLELHPSDTVADLYEVVVTGLLFRAMPFIRYKVGDLARAGQAGCSCRSKQPVIEIVEGRSVDRVSGFENINGGLLFSKIVATVQESGFQGIKAFRAIQKDTTRFQILLNVSPDYNAETGKRIIQLTRVALPDSEVVVSLVDEMPIHPSGKSKPFISEVEASEHNSVQRCN